MIILLMMSRMDLRLAICKASGTQDNQKDTWRN